MESNEKLSAGISQLILKYLIFITIFEIIIGIGVNRYLKLEIEENRKREFETALETFVSNESQIHLNMTTGYAWWDELVYAINSYDKKYIYDNWLDSVFKDNFDFVQLYGNNQNLYYSYYNNKEFFTNKEFTPYKDNKKDYEYYYKVKKEAQKYVEDPKVDLYKNIHEPVFWSFFDDYNGEAYYISLTPICNNNGIPMSYGYMLMGVKVETILRKAEELIPVNFSFTHTLDKNAYGYKSFNKLDKNKKIYINYKPIRLISDFVGTIFILIIFVNIILSTIIFSILVPKFNRKSKESLEYTIDVKTQKLQDANYELNEINEKLNLYSNKLKTLLDNAGQGFLTLNNDLIIEDGYSLECEVILGSNIVGKDINYVLFNSENSDTKKNVDQILDSIFNSSYSIKRKHQYLSLLPEKIVKNNKTIKIEYKYIDDRYYPKVMLILTDITEKIYLQNKMNLEKENLLMIVKIIRNFDEFKKCLKEATQYFSIDIYKEFSNFDKKMLFENFRKIHTFKGDFSQWSMENIASKINELESFLVEIKDKSDIISPQDIISHIINLNISAEIHKTAKKVEEYIGRDILKLDDDSQLILVKKSKLLELENKILNTFESKFDKEIIEDIRRLRYKQVNSFFNNYQEYVDKITKKLGKESVKVNIEDNQILVNEDIYYDFFKSLIHIIRNIIDHGIESSEERAKKNKPINANIYIAIKKVNNNLIITIEDDGKGIDLNKIKEKAVENGLFSKEYIEKLSKPELIPLIFVNELSTKDSVTSLSGRGVGLSAVKDEVEKLDGIINVDSKNNKGTKFTITIPYLS